MRRELNSGEIHLDTKVEELAAQFGPEEVQAILEEVIVETEEYLPELFKKAPDQAEVLACEATHLSYQLIELSRFTGRAALGHAA